MAISTSIFVIVWPRGVSNILVQIVKRNVPVLALVVRGESHEHGIIPGDGDVQPCHVILSVLPHPKSKLAKRLCIVPDKQADQIIAGGYSILTCSAELQADKHSSCCLSLPGQELQVAECSTP